MACGLALQDLKTLTIGMVFDIMAENIPENQRVYEAPQARFKDIFK